MARSFNGPFILISLQVRTFKLHFQSLTKLDLSIRLEVQKRSATQMVVITRTQMSLFHLSQSPAPMFNDAHSVPSTQQNPGQGRVFKTWKLTTTAFKISKPCKRVLRNVSLWARALVSLF